MWIIKKMIYNKRQCNDFNQTMNIIMICYMILTGTKLCSDCKLV